MSANRTIFNSFSDRVKGDFSIQFQATDGSPLSPVQANPALVLPVSVHLSLAYQKTFQKTVPRGANLDLMFQIVKSEAPTIVLRIRK